MNIHHFGYVVQDIDFSKKYFIETYGFLDSKKTIYDPLQHVKLHLLYSSNNHIIELIQPVDEKSPSYEYVQKEGFSSYML